MFKRLADRCLKRTSSSLVSLLLVAGLFFLIPAHSAFAVCVVTNGVCSASAATCTTGSVTGDDAATACGTTRHWGCMGSGGGTTASCTYANAACIAGSCNNAVALGCNSGGASFSDNGITACGGTRRWYCHSPNGGSDSGQCSKANAACPVNAVCGGGAATCSAGTYAGNYSAGSCGGSKTWTCNGANGGSNASCSIANAACPITATWTGNWRRAWGGNTTSSTSGISSVSGYYMGGNSSKTVLDLGLSQSIAAGTSITVSAVYGGTTYNVTFTYSGGTQYPGGFFTCGMGDMLSVTSTSVRLPSCNGGPNVTSVTITYTH